MKAFTLLTQYRTYSKNIQSILIWNITFCLGLGIHLVLYNLYLQSIVFDEIMIGKILGLNFFAQAIIYIPAGLFSDRLGSKKGVLVGVGIFIIALIGNLFANTPDELLVWGFLIGLGNASSIVTFVPLLTEYSNEIERKDLFTFAFSTGTFFTFLGTLLGGIISDNIQAIFHFSETTSLRFTLSITVILLILCTIPLFFIKRRNVPEKEEKSHRSFVTLVKSDPKSLMPIVKFSFSKVLAGVSLGIIAPFINLFFLDKFDLSTSNISIVLAAGTLATVIFMSINPKITNQISEVKTVSLYNLLSIPAVIILGLSQNLWTAIIAFIIFRSANFGLTPIVSKLMMEKVTPEVRGLTNSLGFMVHSLTISLLGPVAMYIVSIVGDYQGYLYLCLISAFGSFIGAIFFHLAFEKKKKHVTKGLENNLA
ncbi:MFS transporter [Bacillus sp. 31A1R]|uniref:MFS transporter n=1 Tax=Robertmurraya mangrovi TaxID=3098077 RepID=A0ABU5J4X8_9BACI|nr:MFS transporter [Bacillus sp. 31A1R]MDZ5474471.1 MFS transporter [Bacillus sp. 31A1R]